MKVARKQTLSHEKRVSQKITLVSYNGVQENMSAIGFSNRDWFSRRASRLVFAIGISNRDRFWRLVLEIGIWVPRNSACTGLRMLSL